MIEIEFTEPNTAICECCNGVTTRLTRFVYKDGDAFAVYYAVFADDHPENAIRAVISIGEWGTDEIPPSRVAFALKLWQQEGNYAVTVTDTDESPWKGTKIIGRMLNRDEALNHEWIDEVYHITDHIFDEDAEIKAFFENETIH